MAESRVLLLSPHCDDIPLSLGASLLRKSWGEAVHVLVVFSRSAYTRFAGWENSIPETSALRQAEEKRAAELAGYTVEFLPFGEPYVRPGYREIGDVFDRQRDTAADAVWPEVRTALLDLLRNWRGVVISPLALGGHIDHRIVRSVFEEATGELDGIAPAFYEDLPYAAQYSSLDIFKSVPAAVRGQALAPVPAPGAPLEDKLELLTVYNSQMTDGMIHNVRAHWMCRGGSELVWSARATHG